jgi:hypothetical protein
MGEASDWKPIAAAPADAGLELSAYEDGEYHVLVFPRRLKLARRERELSYASKADALVASGKQVCFK